MKKNSFIEMYGSCPWMVTQADYAYAIQDSFADTPMLQKLSAFGRQHGPFPEEIRIISPGKIPDALGKMRRLKPTGHALF